MTALAVSAFMGNPSAHASERAPETVARGYKFILASVKPDGGIYHQEDENYNTSICLMALLATHSPRRGGPEIYDEAGHRRHRSSWHF